jgi:hypothetical protein
VASPVNVDLIPEPGRPRPVDKLLGEAIGLRDQLRSAQEKLAAAEAEAARQEQVDVEQAAQRIRSGSSPGSPAAAIEKARREVALAKRGADALRIASEAAQDDLVEAITANADAWLATLDEEAERARERGRKAIAELEAATQQIRDAASAGLWLRSGLDDQRFDRRPGGVVIGSSAPSSKNVTANSEALTREQLLAFVGELVEQPAPPARAAGFAQANAAGAG